MKNIIIMIVKETISKYGKSKIVRVVAVFLLAVIALYLGVWEQSFWFTENGVGL